jgi:hypothetical protein
MPSKRPAAPPTKRRSARLVNKRIKRDILRTLDRDVLERIVGFLDPGRAALPGLPSPDIISLASTTPWLRTVVASVAGKALDWHSDIGCLCGLRKWLALSAHELRTLTLRGCQCNDPVYSFESDNEYGGIKACDVLTVFARAAPALTELDVTSLHLCSDDDFDAFGTLLKTCRDTLRVLSVPAWRERIILAIDHAGLSQLTAIRLLAPGPLVSTDLRGSRVLCAIAGASPMLEELDVSGVSLASNSDLYALRALLSDVRETLKDLTLATIEPNILGAVAKARLTSLTKLSILNLRKSDSADLGSMIRSTCAIDDDRALSPSPIRELKLRRVTSLPVVKEMNLPSVTKDKNMSMAFLLQNVTAVTIEAGPFAAMGQRSDDMGAAFISELAPNVPKLTLRCVDLAAAIWKGMVTALGGSLRELRVEARHYSSDVSKDAAEFIAHVAATSSGISVFELCVWPPWNRFPVSADSESGVALKQATQKLRKAAPELDMQKFDILVQALLAGAD